MGLPVVLYFQFLFQIMDNFSSKLDKCMSEMAIIRKQNDEILKILKKSDILHVRSGSIVNVSNVANDEPTTSRSRPNASVSVVAIDNETPSGSGAIASVSDVTMDDETPPRPGSAVSVSDVAIDEEATTSTAMRHKKSHRHSRLSSTAKRIGPQKTTAKLHDKSTQKVSYSDFTFEEEFCQIKIDWLEKRSTMQTRSFIRDLLRKLFEASELCGRNATGRPAPGCRLETAKPAIESKRREFIESKIMIN